MDHSSSSLFSFSEYVLLSPSSVNHDWTSRTIRAIVAPKLAVPLLLGGPFLSHNCLIIDHDSRTCIAKDSNYDLLNPIKYEPKAEVQIPSRRDMICLRKDVVNELKSVLNSRHEENDKSSITETPHVATLLRQ